MILPYLHRRWRTTSTYGYIQLNFFRSIPIDDCTFHHSDTRHMGYCTQTVLQEEPHRRDFYFSFMLMSVAIFFLVYFMIFELEDLKTKTSIGIGIGLFGIFSIMRYRTDAMPVRERTEFFFIIAPSVINWCSTTASTSSHQKTTTTHEIHIYSALAIK